MSHQTPPALLSVGTPPLISTWYQSPATAGPKETAATSGEVAADLARAREAEESCTHERRGERPGRAARAAAAAASWTGGRAPARALPRPRAAAEEEELLGVVAGGVVAGVRVLSGSRQRSRGGALVERRSACVLRALWCC